MFIFVKFIVCYIVLVDLKGRLFLKVVYIVLEV